MNTSVVLSMAVCAFLVASCAQHEVTENHANVVVQHQLKKDTFLSGANAKNEENRQPDGYFAAR